MFSRKIVKRFSSNYFLDYHKDKAYNTILNKTNNIFRKQGFENRPGFVDLSFSEPIAKHYLAHDFIHQTVAAIINPRLINSNEMMPQAKERAKKYLTMPGFNVGAYSESRGTPFLRKNVIKYLENRDGVKIDMDDVYMANGGANAYDHVIQLIYNKGETILVPNPCPPIFLNFHTVFELNSAEYKYDLNNFKLNFNSLFSAYKANASDKLKAILVINPNEPLGNVLSEEEMREIVKFSYDNRLVLIAYEVLQESIYNSKLKYNSFRRIVSSMPGPYNQLELLSIHSTSKTPYFESSFRSAIFDVMNIDRDVAMQLYKYKSIDLCSNIPGQIVMDLVCSPPSKEEFGEEFYNNYNLSIAKAKRENEDTVKLVRATLSNNTELTVPYIDSGYSFFCKLNPSEKLRRQAKELGKTPTQHYVDSLFEEKNILINDGAEFGSRAQEEHYLNIYANINAVEINKYAEVKL